MNDNTAATASLNAAPKSRGKILLISGCAGSGKGTVIAELIKKSKSFCYSVSMTTRKPREGEVHGINYFFVSRESFIKSIENNELVEHTDYCGNYYGTPKSFLYERMAEGKTVILEIEIEGAANVIRLTPDEDIISVFLSAPSFTELEARLRGRGTDSEDSIKKRLETAKTETQTVGIYKHIVINHTGRAKDAADCVFNIWQKACGNFEEAILITPENVSSCEVGKAEFLEGFFGKGVF